MQLQKYSLKIIFTVFCEKKYTEKLYLYKKSFGKILFF